MWVPGCSAVSAGRWRLLSSSQVLPPLASLLLWDGSVLIPQPLKPLRFQQSCGGVATQCRIQRLYIDTLDLRCHIGVIRRRRVALVIGSGAAVRHVSITLASHPANQMRRTEEELHWLLIQILTMVKES